MIALPDNIQLLPATLDFLSKEHRLFIGGAWVAPLNGKTLPVENPANGQLIAQIPLADARDVDAAVIAAQKAFDPDFSPSKRARLLWTLADLIRQHVQELAELETLDNGKPIDQAKADVLGAAQHFRYYAGWADKIEGHTIPVSAKNRLVYTRREPLGVVGLIVPWNFPLLMAAWKLAPALACGNSVILKPAEQTSLTALRLGELIAAAGFPPGMVNIVTGPGTPTGEAMTRHPGIAKIGFTGSTAVGKKIMEAAAQSNLKRVSLELGGKSPNIIFEDAPLEAVQRSLTWSSFYNSGQECTLGSRIYIHNTLFDQVVDGLAAAGQQLRLGNGLLNPDLGPLISQQQYRRVQGYIDQGLAEGATRILGERQDQVPEEGYFLPPTIFRHQNEELSIVQEEIFGPVVVVSAFEDPESIAARANHSAYGLAAAIWTKDISKAHRLAHQLQAGTVWINGYDMFDPAVPFGGYKESGIGREMGKSALDLYTQEKAIWVAL